MSDCNAPPHPPAPQVVAELHGVPATRLKTVPGHLVLSRRTHCYFLTGQQLLTAGRAYRALGVSPNGYVSVSSNVAGVRDFLAPDDYTPLGEGPLPPQESE